MIAYVMAVMDVIIDKVMAVVDVVIEYMKNESVSPCIFFFLISGSAPFGLPASLRCPVPAVVGLSALLRRVRYARCNTPSQVERTDLADWEHLFLSVLFLATQAAASQGSLWRLYCGANSRRARRLIRRSLRGIIAAGPRIFEGHPAQRARHPCLAFYQTGQGGLKPPPCPRLGRPTQTLRRRAVKSHPRWPPTASPPQDQKRGLDS